MSRHCILCKSHIYNRCKVDVFLAALCIAFSAAIGPVLKLFLAAGLQGEESDGVTVHCVAVLGAEQAAALKALGS